MSFGEAIQPIEMLLVEDNPGDVRLTAEALKEIKQEINLSVVGDGVEALAFLRKQGKYAGSARPRLALLDLNLPKKNGHEVLEEITTLTSGEYRLSSLQHLSRTTTSAAPTSWVPTVASRSLLIWTPSSE